MADEAWASELAWRRQRELIATIEAARMEIIDLRARVADRDLLAARLAEQERNAWRLSHAVREMQLALGALVEERDAARAEAARALEAPLPHASLRTAHVEDVPAGLHSVTAFRRAY